jgi:glyoxylase-like metal-dependent hydrolase (beta-lactamase superfamily II)
MEFQRFSLGDLATNSYVLYDQAKGVAALFDAPAQADVILDFLNGKGVELKYIFLTHAHFDHIMALKELKEATGAKIVVHNDEEQYLNNTELNLSYFPLPDVKADILVNDGDIVEFADLRIKVIHTPGHTLGGVCYLFEKTLVSGDTLFYGSIGRYDFPMGDFDTEINSIKEKLLILPDDIKVYPGHGPSTTIGNERKGNPYLL